MLFKDADTMCVLTLKTDRRYKKTPVIVSGICFLPGIFGGEGQAINLIIYRNSKNSLLLGQICKSDCGKKHF